MSRSTAPETWRKKRARERWRQLGRAAGPVVGAVACVSTASCGGSERATSSTDAAIDSTVEQVLGPLDPDPCDASKALAPKSQSIADFGPGSGLAGMYAIYVSSDLTGQVFGCVNDAGVTTSPCAVSSEAPVPTNAIQCHTGWQPSAGEGTELPEPRCGVDSHGVHLRAIGPNDAGLTAWGMNLSVDLRQNCNQPSQPDAAICTYDAGARGTNGLCEFDASSWTGVSFWARLGVGQSTATTALVTLADPQTAGQLGGCYPYNDLVCGDPGCVFDAGVVGASAPLKCDPFGKAVALVDHWEFYAIPFSEMRQKGFGLPESAPDLVHFLGVKVSLGKGTWDVWIDDISLYGKKTP